ncbi:MAG: GNAT family N-acetyltransferase [Siphonobacter sp.]
MINLFKATSDHIDQVLEIGRSTFIDTFAEQNTPEDLAKYINKAFHIEQVRSEVLNPDSLFFLAELGDQIIGYLKLNIGKAQSDVNDSESLEIERIYVKKDFIGKEVGKLLFEKALSTAHELNLKYIWLGVWEHNPRAIRFYEKQGFQQFGTHTFVLGEDVQTDLLLKLYL